MGLREIDRVFVEENGKRLPPWIIKLVFRYIFGLFSLFSHRIIVHESFQKDQLIHEHFVSADKVVVIPHGVPENPIIQEKAREYFSLPGDQKIFLYMGFAARYK
jgi:glycosyltransferase involved in cell wall biosynthesis